MKKLKVQAPIKKMPFKNPTPCKRPRIRRKPTLHTYDKNMMPVKSALKNPNSSNYAVLLLFFYQKTVNY